MRCIIAIPHPYLPAIFDDAALSGGLDADRLIGAGGDLYFFARLYCDLDLSSLAAIVHWKMVRAAHAERQGTHVVDRRQHIFHTARCLIFNLLALVVAKIFFREHTSLAGLVIGYIGLQAAQAC